MTWLLKLATKFGWPSWVASLVFYLILVAITLGTIWSIYNKGQRDERAIWVAAENLEIANNKAEINRLNTALNDLAKLTVAMFGAKKAEHEKELANEKQNFERVLADVKSGVKRLSFTTKTVPACSGGIILPAEAGGETVGETRAELSDEAAELIVRFAHDANNEVIAGNHLKENLKLCYKHVDELTAILNPTQPLINQ